MEKAKNHGKKFVSVTIPLFNKKYVRGIIYANNFK